ncbi:MAG: hypothetical protein KTR31_01565 [Myxococcales bacterium]|nr:hypothetical protein [Myxococcales bacterium]
MNEPSPDRALLAQQIRWACGRGIPVQVAEDLVFEAVERTRASWEPARGPYAGYLHAAVRNACTGWWRRRAIDQRAKTRLSWTARSADGAQLERAERKQRALLDALDDEERRIFSAWALQKHLGKGQITSVEVSRSLDLEVSAYENAKRRLKARLHRLLDELGWEVADVLHGGIDVESVE